MHIATTVNPTAIADFRNTTYETNHDIITSWIHNYLLENRHCSTMGTIIKETKLSRQTAYNHLNSGLKAKYKTLVKGKFEIMAINASALKHFINLPVGSVNNTTIVNNYIQINNLKISNEEFNQLPKETLM